MSDNQDDYSFVEGIRDIYSRMSPVAHVPLLRDLLAHQKKWGLDEVESILSLGPAAGDNDVAVLPAFPRCRHFICVERDDQCVELFRQTFRRYYPQLDVAVHKEDICTFEGPTDPVDAIFAFNVLNEIPNPVEILSKMKDWLKPGGHLFVWHGNENNNWATPILKKLYPDHVDPAYLHENLKQDLTTVNQLELVDECHYEHTIDFRQKSKQFGWFFSRKFCTDSEVDDIHEAFRSLNDTQLFSCGQSLTVYCKNAPPVY